MFSHEEQRLIEISAIWGRVAEREGYSDGGWPMNPAHTGFSGGPGITDKSALFQRLLAGKAPLAYRPPTSHSYPWYSVVEGAEREHRVFVGTAPTLGALARPGADENEHCVVINGAFWRIDQTIREGGEYIVSWGLYPMRWRLVLERANNGTVSEKLRERETFIREYLTKPREQGPLAHIFDDGEENLSPEECEQRVQEDLRAFEASLRNPEHTGIEIDANDTCWELVWTLKRVGLSGWPFAGTVRAVEQKFLACVMQDDYSAAVLFEADEEIESDDPGGVAWLQIEHDEESGVSRYVSGIVSSRTNLEEAIKDDLPGLVAKAMARTSISIMDRRDADGVILGMYDTKIETPTERVKV